MIVSLVRRSGRPDELLPLLGPALRGDRPAMEQLLARVGPRMLRVIRQVLGPSHPEAEDVLQEAAFAFVDALPGSLPTSEGLPEHQRWGHCGGNLARALAVGEGHCEETARAAEDGSRGVKTHS